MPHFSKFALQGRSFSQPHRRGAAIDLLVLLLAFVTLLFWIAGQVYLAVYPLPVDVATQVRGGTSTIEVVNQPEHESEDLVMGSLDESNDKNSFGSDPENAAVDATTRDRLLAKAELDEMLQAKETELTSRFRTQLDSIESQLNSAQVELRQSQNALAVNQGLIEQKDKTIASLSVQIEKFESENSASVIPLIEPVQQQPAKINAPVFREWTGNNGRKAEMAFLRWQNDQIVFIDRQDRVFTLPPSRLSDADRLQIESLKPSPELD